MVAPGHEPDLLTAAEVAAILRVGKSTVFKLLKDGALPHYRVSSTTCGRGRILVARADLEAFLAASRQGPRRAPVGVDADAVLAQVRARGRSQADPWRERT